MSLETTNGEVIETSRKLATVQLISALSPITFNNAEGELETAASIEVATILGWKCVVKKGEFKVGDLCAYLEIDSVIDTELLTAPEAKPFNFLATKSKNGKFRVKTIKLKGQVSQGLALPLSAIWPNAVQTDSIAWNGSNKPMALAGGIMPFCFYEGDDLTELLEVVKYEPTIPAFLMGKVKGNFPSFLIKTDESRVQTCNRIVEAYFKYPFYAAEKLDGSSFTAYLKDGVFGVCSRNLDLSETDENAFWQLARKIDLEDRLKAIGSNVALQGEMIGPGIQGNKYKRTQTELYVFNLFDIDNSEYYDYINLLVTTQKVMELKTVPIKSVYDNLLGYTVDKFLAEAEFKSTLNENTWAEGLVYRSRENITIDGFGRLSFKAISNKFLLKNDE